MTYSEVEVTVFSIFGQLKNVLAITHTYYYCNKQDAMVVVCVCGD